MSRVISGSYTTPITLSSYADNPVTVTGTITVSGGALVGQSPTSWTITNQGAIESSGAVGIDLANGGSVGNDMGALISGYSYALRISGAAGNLVNAGSMGVIGVQGRAIALNAGGSVTNQTSGTITGFLGIYAGGTSLSTVVNAGIISSSGALGHGITLNAGGIVTNQAGGTISSSSAPIALGGSGGTIINAGTIHGSVGAGVSLPQGVVDNQLGGSIYGYSYGVSQTYGMLTNAGEIIGLSSGANLDGGVVTNQSGGTIVGGQHGVYVGVFGSGTVINAGYIAANTASGIRLNGGGAVTNQAGGVILGYDGIYIAGGTVVNAGTIDMTGTKPSDRAVYLGPGHTNRMVVYPGSSFNAPIGSTAVVDGGNTIGSATISTLELASAASNGTLSGLGTQFIDFAQTTIDAGATWTLTGSNTLASGSTLTNSGTLTLSGASFADAGALENDGGIVLDPSTLTVADLTGTGSVTIAAGSTLEAKGIIASGQTIAFGGGGAYLHLDSPTNAAGSVINFDLGETIDLNGVSPGSVSFSSGTLQFTGGSFTLSLASAGTVHATASTDGAAISLCFCVNTLILTPSGERRVQQLAVGDAVTTYRGETRRIAWIGTGKVLATRGRRNAATPVIVRRGALADNVPSRDLRVTKGHALYLDDALIPVEYLVNHRSIEWDDRAQEVELYHIELETHDVLIADGAPTESYRDDGNRWLFRNANSGWDLPQQQPCAPILTGGPVVDAAWRRLLGRAGARPGLPLTDEPDLHLLVDGQRLDAAKRHGDVHVFRLPARPESARIVSRAAAPQELGLARDPRVLGVALRRIVLSQGRRLKLIEADDVLLADGFHAFEPDNGFRWTDGDAALPAALFGDFPGAVDIELHVACTTRYVAAGEQRQVA